MIMMMKRTLALLAACLPIFLLGLYRIASHSGLAYHHHHHHRIIQQPIRHQLDIPTDVAGAAAAVRSRPHLKAEQLCRSIRLASTLLTEPLGHCTCPYTHLIAGSYVSRASVLFCFWTGLHVCLFDFQHFSLPYELYFTFK